MEQSKPRARRNERRALRLADEVAGQRDQILTYLGGLDDEPLMSGLGEPSTWAQFFRDELAELEEIARRLRTHQVSVSRAEIDRVVTIGEHLERILLKSRLAPYLGSWVAVRGAEVVASAPGPAELDRIVRQSGKPVDLFFRVSGDAELIDV